MRSNTRVFFGLLLVLLGTLIFLRMMGIVTFSIWSGLGKYWPVMIILVGIAIIFRRGWPVFALLILGSVLLGLVFYPASTTLEPKQFMQTVENSQGITNTDISIHYGAGDLNIAGGSKDYFAKVNSLDFTAPILTSKSNDTIETIDIQRGDVHFDGARAYNSNWDIELSPDVVNNLNLNYGATSTKIDLTGLKVDNLTIESGATSTQIIYGDYPTKSTIHSGASSFDLKFPKGIGVKINFKGGLASAYFPGFKKDGDTYYSDNYNPDGKNIELDIETGASSVSGTFY